MGWKRKNKDNFSSWIRTAKNKGRSHCEYCGKKLSIEDSGELDHMIPRSQDGPDEYWNAKWACRECHGKKTKEEQMIGVRKYQKEKKERKKQELRERGAVDINDMIRKIKGINSED